MRLGMGHDLRCTIRGLAKQRGFTTVAVLTLALGIGATSAMFSILHAVLLAPLPYNQAGRVVTVWSQWQDFDKTWLSRAEVVDYRQLTRVFTNVGAWRPTHVSLSGQGDVIQVGAANVTTNTFEVLGARPWLGRTFTDGDDQPSEAPVAVMSFGLWQRYFGGDPDIVGKRIDLDDHRTLVIGVMPKGFRLPTDYGEDAAAPTELWTPLVIDPVQTDRGGHELYGAARLVPGITVQQVNAELRAVTNDWTQRGVYPPAMHFSAFAVPVTEDVLGGVRPALWILSAAVLFLLLIACTNVAALLLARAEGRQREFAVRTALGASRARLMRQLLIEGAVLACAGGALGVVLALVAGRVVGATPIPRAAEISVDWRVLAFTLTASAITAVLFTLPPALRAARVDLVDGLKDGSVQATPSRRRLRTRGLMVVSQLALASLLLAGAGLMVRSLWALQHVRLGFRPDHVLTARLELPAKTYDSPGKILDFYRRLLPHVRAIPGVVTAGLLRSLPLGSTIGDWGLDVEGYTPPPGQPAKGDWQAASDGGIEALGEELLRGRSFTPADDGASMPVALINETMARTYWPNQDPVGKRFRMGDATRPWVTIVGIVGNVRHNGVTLAIKEKFYRPFAQFQQSTGFALADATLVIRSIGEPVRLADPLRTAVRELDPRLPLGAVRPMTDVVAATMATSRLTSGVLTAFAGVALLLAAIGVYGLLSYFVAERTYEIGVRVAIGAGADHVLRLVLGQGLRLIGLGVAAGLALTLVSTSALTHVLYGVTPFDAPTFVCASAVLIAVATSASAIPAWRATRVEPVKALKRD